MLAKDFVQRFMDATLDQANVRWKATEVVRYINDGQRDIAIYRPDAFSLSGELETVPGTRQELPAGDVKVLRFVRNEVGTKRALKIVAQDELDAIDSNWHNTTPSNVIRNVTYDERVPREYYCFPPSDGAARLWAIRCVEPTDVPTPGSEVLSGVTGSLSVQALFINPLLDYVLYRAYAKDAGVPGNFQKAKLRYELYAAAIGIENKATLEFGPNANGALAAPRNPPTKPALQ